MPDNTIKPRNKVKIKITKEITTAFIGKINEEKVISSKTYKYTFSKDYKSKTDKEKKTLAKIIFTSETKSKKLNKTDKHTTKKKITSVLTKDSYKKGDTIQIPLIKRKVSFTKLDEAEFYDEVYIIVQSKGLESGETIVELRQGDKEELELEGVGIYVQHNNSNVKEIKEKIGNFSRDGSIENKDDFKDWSIAKIKLAPKNETKLKLYRKFLKDATDKKANLYLLVKANVSGESFTNTFYNEVHGKIANRWYDGDADGVEWFGLKYKVRLYLNAKGFSTNDNITIDHIPALESGRPHMNKKIIALILHRSVSSNYPGGWMKSKTKIKGAHFYVDKDGTVYQTASLNISVAHIYASSSKQMYAEYFGILKNSNTIGIEVIGNYIDSQWEALTNKQIEATSLLVAQIKGEFSLTNNNIYPHEKVQRKTKGEGQTVLDAINVNI